MKSVQLLLMHQVGTGVGLEGFGSRQCVDRLAQLLLTHQAGVSGWVRRSGSRG